MAKIGKSICMNSLIGDLGLDPARARVVLGIVSGKVFPLENPGGDFPLTRKWARDCLTLPSRRDVAIHAIDEIIGSYGVEWIGTGNGYGGPGFEYCNTGDTYEPTIVRIEGEFRIASWGDIVERFSGEDEDI